MNMNNEKNKDSYKNIHSALLELYLYLKLDKIRNVSNKFI